MILLQESSVAEKEDGGVAGVEGEGEEEEEEGGRFDSGGGEVVGVGQTEAGNAPGTFLIN